MAVTERRECPIRAETQDRRGLTSEVTEENDAIRRWDQEGQPGTHTFADVSDSTDFHCLARGQGIEVILPDTLDLDCVERFATKDHPFAAVPLEPLATV